MSFRTKVVFSFILLASTLSIFRLEAIGESRVRVPLKETTSRHFIGDEAVSTAPGIGPSRSSPAPYPPGDTIGCTYYEFQQNGSMGRQIAWSSANNRIHFVWSRWSTDHGPRTVRYNSRADEGTGTWAWSSGLSGGKDISEIGGGYANCDVRADGAAVVTFHEVPIPGVYITNSGYDTIPPEGAFDLVDAPAAPNCSGVESGSIEFASNYIWPKVEWQDVGGANIRHIVSCEAPPEGTPADEIKSIIYYRYADAVASACIPNSDDTLGTYIDATYTVNPVVRADPNSDNVAIVYLKPLYDRYDPRDPCDWIQWQHDVVYLESTDGGVSFQDGTASFMNITDYTLGGTLDTDELEHKAYIDLSALYDHNGVLHVVWSTPIYEPDSTEPCRPLYSSRLWHWDNSGNCIALVYDAEHPRCHCPEGTGAFNVSIAKMNISECYSTGEAEFGLFVSFTRFGAHTVPGDDDISSDCSDDGFSNGDIFITASSDGGTTWNHDASANGSEGDGTPWITGSAIDLTNTLTDNCDRDFCHSEHWASMTKYSEDFLHIAYVDDNDAGTGIRGNEGAITNNAYKYTRYSWFKPAPVCSLVLTESLFDIMIAPYDSTGCINQYQDTIGFEIMNFGNQTVDYLASADSSWIHPGTSPGTIETGCDPTTTLQFTVGPIPEPGYYGSTIAVEYTCIDGNGTLFVAVNVQVICERDSVQVGCTPGDAEESGTVDIDDVVYCINYIFTGGPSPHPDLCCADANASCAIDVDDVVYLIGYIFTGGAAPQESCSPDNCGPF
ncbi:MAG: hypothetical protein ABIK83_02005 [Candidatus Zixiibacteriota bacterium]